MTTVPSARELLDAAYADLELKDGALLPATKLPSDGVSEADWLSKGEWLSLANSVGAERLFFVRDNPVVVFAVTEENDDHTLRELVNCIWCMARPQQLFVARPGELLVLDMTRPPVARNEAIDAENRLLAKVKSIAEVQSRLAAFRRERLETGVLPEGQGYFSPGDARADKTLVNDLKAVRKALIDAGLDGENSKYANALIGRSIFIRYLEDRRILRATDFAAVASRRKRWQATLASNAGASIEPWMEHVQYTKVLSNKDFTYALFDQLAADFNGDMFPVTSQEREVVSGEHLRLLQRFLTGQMAGNTLFFFAYRFDIIPIELISSIYEEFYNAESGTDSNQGTHYTPIELVEYLLAKVLTAECLRSNPTVLDPACGSGVFLVEAFRRIVRFRQMKSQRRLGLPELRKIIRDQLRGIDINGEAIRVAAFSLYLAMLHHLVPPDVWRDKRLPNLTYDPDAGEPDTNHFDILLATNAFTVEAHVRHDEVLKKFSAESVDVLVGNPPWGYPKRTDLKGTAAARDALSWCSQQKCDVGDQELSQAFIHRALDLLKPGGRCAMLVSTGVFFKRHANSDAFRRQWLSRARLDNVVNFAAVRTLYFSSGIAPFASIVFKKESLHGRNHYVEYWTAKHTLQAKQMRAVVLSFADRQRVQQTDASEDARIWKIYWWGSHLDHALIQALSKSTPFGDVIAEKNDWGSHFGLGTQSGSDESPDWLAALNILPTKVFRRYGPIDRESFEPPSPTFRARTGQPLRGIFLDRRILVKRGVSSHGRNIIARYESSSDPYRYKHSIYGMDVAHLPEWQANFLLAILWSSLARYYLWMTSGAWGMWHHALDPEDLKRLPVVFPREMSLRNRILRVVDSLRNSQVQEDSLLSGDAATIKTSECGELERELDELIFDCYGLSQSERQLVRDMCDVGLELFYRHCESKAVKRLSLPDDFVFGVTADLDAATVTGRSNDLEGYVRVFTNIWNQQLAPAGECVWRVIRQSNDPTMIAVILEPIGRGDSPDALREDEPSWNEVLKKLDETSVQHDGSRRVFIDGVVASVGETEIIMIKRNERRLWTQSAAREDAEATIALAMQLQELREGNQHAAT